MKNEKKRSENVITARIKKEINGNKENKVRILIIERK